MSKAKSNYERYIKVQVDCGKSISAVDSYVKELEEQKAELIEYVNNQADECEDESARKFLLKHKKYQIQNKPDEHM
jgi:hypothetical protein